MILGICGKIASGKSHFAKAIAEQGYADVGGRRIPLEQPELIEADTLAHDLYTDEFIHKELADCFGDSILAGDFVSRSRLREVAFFSDENLLKLEAILHPPMRRRLSQLVKAARAEERNAVVVAALPRSFHLDEFCDEVLELPITKEEAWQRVQERSPQLQQAAFEIIWQRQEQEYPCPTAQKA